MALSPIMIPANYRKRPPRLSIQEHSLCISRCPPFVNHETDSNMEFDDWMLLKDERELAEQEWSVEEYLTDEEFKASIQKFLVEVGIEPKHLLK